MLELPGERGTCDLGDCFTDSRPLVSIPADTLFRFRNDDFDAAAIAKSGGSCVAGYGEYVFGEDGMVYTKDLSIPWNLQLKSIVSSNAFDFVEETSLSAVYPVVVSADQRHSAFVLQRDENCRKELWVAAIAYLRE